MAIPRDRNRVEEMLASAGTLTKEVNQVDTLKGHVEMLNARIDNQNEELLALYRQLHNR